MSESLRGGVIGAGVFGGYHARQYATLPGVVLSGVFDPHPDRAARVAVPLKGRAFRDLSEFLEEVAGEATVTTSTSSRNSEKSRNARPFSGTATFAARSGCGSNTPDSTTPGKVAYWRA